MTLADHWRRVPSAYKIASVGSLAVALIGALVIALLLGYSGSTKGAEAAHEARSVAQCINDNLADRNGATSMETAATAEHAVAEAAYSAAFADLVAAIVAKNQAKTAVTFQTFAVRAQAMKIADARYQTALYDVAQIRAKHPLGRC